MKSVTLDNVMEEEKFCADKSVLLSDVTACCHPSPFACPFNFFLFVLHSSNPFCEHTRWKCSSVFFFFLFLVFSAEVHNCRRVRLRQLVGKPLPLSPGFCSSPRSFLFFSSSFFLGKVLAATQTDFRLEINRSTQSTPK